MFQHNDLNKRVYFNFSRYWGKKIKPIIEKTEAQTILKHDFKKYVDVKRADYIENAIELGVAVDFKAWQFEDDKFPADFDSCDWRCNRRSPAWNKYVCHGACHFIVNTLLHVAMNAYPKKSWRIVTSSKHSLVWDGGEILFDLNFVTLKVPISECIKNAFLNSDTKILDPGEYLEIY